MKLKKIHNFFYLFFKGRCGQIFLQKPQRHLESCMGFLLPVLFWGKVASIQFWSLVLLLLIGVNLKYPNFSKIPPTNSNLNFCFKARCEFWILDECGGEQEFMNSRPIFVHELFERSIRYSLKVLGIWLLQKAPFEREMMPNNPLVMQTGPP